MIASMRELALDYLLENLNEGDMPENLEAWYQNLRLNSPGQLFPYLVEDSGKVDKVYILEQESADTARLTVEDVVQGKEESGGCSNEQTTLRTCYGDFEALFRPRKWD